MPCTTEATFAPANPFDQLTARGVRTARAIAGGRVRDTTILGVAGADAAARPRPAWPASPLCGQRDGPGDQFALLAKELHCTAQSVAPEFGNSRVPSNGSRDPDPLRGQPNRVVTPSSDNTASPGRSAASAAIRKSWGTLVYRFRSSAVASASSDRTSSSSSPAAAARRAASS